MKNPGWIRFILLTLSQAYLVFAASLAAIALLPALLAGWHGFVVESGSMGPLISPGDVALTAQIADGTPVAIGAVIAYENPAEAEPSGAAQVRLHRVVSVNADGGYVTAGDANVDIDSSPVARDQIIGQALVLVRIVGLPAFWLTHGDLLPFIAWAVVSLGALISAALGFPNRHVASPPRKARKARSRAPRRIGRAVTPHGILTVVGACAIGALVGAAGLTATPAMAAFSTQTRTSTSWQTDAAVVLTTGRLTPYGIFAATSIVDGAGSTFVLGSLGTSTGTTITGFTTGEVSGSTDKNNQVAKDAKTDALALAAAIAARTSTARAAALSGTITPGTYRSSGTSFTIATSITLNAGGDASAIFVFTAPSLSVAASATVNLTNGASAKNVYWRIAGAVTLGTNSLMRGTVIAVGGNITGQDGFDLFGRLVSTTGTVSTLHGSILLP